MKVTILGCGAAGGVPMISVGWGRCDSANPKNRRRRPSILIEHEKATILIDAGPDLRAQLLDVGVNRLDAVFFTHGHADHTHGIDDLREVNRIMRAPLMAYGEAHCFEGIQERFGYVFEPLDLETMPIYKPLLVRNDVSGAFSVNGLEVMALTQDHGYGQSTGFRIGNFAYCTDVWNFPDQSFEQLFGLEAWIVGCLQFKPHNTHAHIGKVLEWVQELKPATTYLTHMGPGLDYDELIRRTLPENVKPCWDGLVLDIP